MTYYERSFACFVFLGPAKSSIKVFELLLIFPVQYRLITQFFLILSIMFLYSDNDRAYGVI